MCGYPATPETSMRTVEAEQYLSIDTSMHLRQVGVSPYDSTLLYHAARDNPHLADFETWPFHAQTPNGAMGIVSGTRKAVREGTALPYNVLAGTPEDDASDGGDLLGRVEVHGIVNDNDFGRYGHLWYWVTAEAQGRNVAYRASQTLLNHGFDAYDLDVVMLQIDVRNVRSQHLAERLGATLTKLQTTINRRPHQVWQLLPEDLSDE